MNCREFRDDVDEFLDETLDAPRAAAARDHVATCAHCQLTLQRLESFGRTLSRELDVATAGIALSPASRRQILDAVHGRRTAEPVWHQVWHWLKAHPVRALAPVATFVLVLLLTLQFRQLSPRARAVNPTLGVPSYLVDVPFRTEIHVFQLQNGTVVDTVLTHVAVSHASFSATD
jgi:hypothetical protein